MLSPVPFPDDVRTFVDMAAWTFARTYALTWPHEYVLRTDENREMLLKLARHIFDYGEEGRFYHHLNLYHHEEGLVYWSMDLSPEATTLVNRCLESQTYEARKLAGTLPPRRR